MNTTTCKSSPNTQKPFQLEKNKFLKWASQWAKDTTNVDETAIDAPEITAVLQSMGFNLQKFERSGAFVDQKTDSEVKIEVFCAKSRMHAVLIKQDTACTCPNSEQANDSKFWVVSGTGPTSSQDGINKIEQSFSSLLPIVSPETSLIIKEIILKLFSIINNTDVNQNSKNFETEHIDLKRTRSLDAICNTDTPKSSESKKCLNQQFNWDVDPKISPPTGTSSPIPDICKTLDQISLNSDRDTALTQVLLHIKDNLEKALQLLPTANNTFTKIKVPAKRISNISKVSPIITTPTRSTSSASTAELPVKMSPKKSFLSALTPSKNKPFKKTPVCERKILAVSKIGSFRKKPMLLTPSNLDKSSEKSKVSKQDTPFPSIKPRTPNQLLPQSTKNSMLRSSSPNILKSDIFGTAKLKSGIPSFSSKLPKTTSLSALKKPK